MRIVVTRAFELSVTADGKTEYLKMTGGDVKSLLQEKKYSLGVYDAVTPPITTELSGGLQIQIDRVEYSEESEELELPFEILKENSNEILKG